MFLLDGGDRIQAVDESDAPLDAGLCWVFFDLLFLLLLLLVLALLLLQLLSVDDVVPPLFSDQLDDDGNSAASFPIALRSSKCPLGSVSGTDWADTTVTTATTPVLRIRSASRAAAVMTQSSRKTDTTTEA